MKGLINSGYILGAVDGGEGILRVKRIRQIFSIMRELLWKPEDDLQAGTEDVYRPGRRVRIEGEAERQTDLQEGLDDEVTRENLGDDSVQGMGHLPPCKRVGEEATGSRRRR